MADEDDDGWLADDEGNLRPDVARMINQEPDRPVNAPEALPGPDPVPASVDRSGGCLLTAVVALLLLLLASKAVDHYQRSTAHQWTRAFEARVVVEKSVLRRQAGLQYPAVEPLVLGDSLFVFRGEAGWYYAVVHRGPVGWIYGGFVCGVNGPWKGPGLVVEELRLYDDEGRRDIKPGEWVLIAKKKRDGRMTLLLPDGVRMEAPAGAVRPVE